MCRNDTIPVGLQHITATPRYLPCPRGAGRGERCTLEPAQTRGCWRPPHCLQPANPLGRNGYCHSKLMLLPCALNLPPPTAPISTGQPPPRLIGPPKWQVFFAQGIRVRNIFFGLTPQALKPYETANSDVFFSAAFTWTETRRSSRFFFFF